MPLLALATFAFKYADNSNALALCIESLFDACANLRALFGSSGSVKLEEVFKNAGDMQNIYRDWDTRGSQGAEMTTVVRISKFSKFSALCISKLSAY